MCGYSSASTKLCKAGGILYWASVLYISFRLGGGVEFYRGQECPWTPFPPYLPREDGFYSADTHFSLDGVADIVQVSSLDDSSQLESAGAPNVAKATRSGLSPEDLETLKLVDRFAKTKAGQRWCRRYWHYVRKKGVRRFSLNSDLYKIWIKRLVGYRGVDLCRLWRLFLKYEKLKKAKKKDEKSKKKDEKTK